MTDRHHPLVAVLETVTPACCPGRINFHCHTTSSDGSLQPEALAGQALAIGLEHLAVTDHHSTAAFLPIQHWFEQQAEAGSSPPQLWTGMEISCLLEGCLVHVLALLAYHFFCYRLMGQLQQGSCGWSPKQLRALNELPTLLLVIVVMLVVFKNQFPTGAATWFIVALVVFMAASIQFYARWRRLRAQKEAAAA